MTTAYALSWLLTLIAAGAFGYWTGFERGRDEATFREVARRMRESLKGLK